MSRPLAIAITVALSGACRAIHAPVYTDADARVPDAAPPPDASLACVRAEDALRKHHCPEADGQPWGRSFIDVCDRAEATPYLTLNPACIADAPDVAALRACHVKCVGGD